MATTENEYYLRSVLLLSDGGSYIAKTIISRELSRKGGTLDALLKQEQFKNKIKHEFKNKKQLEKLFPSSGETDVNSWDIQMLTGTILILFRSDLNTEEKHNVKTIKQLRHELAHSPAATLQREVYEDLINDLAEAMKSLASRCEENVQKKCDELIEKFKACPLDVRSSTEQFKELKDKDELFVKVFEEFEKLSDEVSAAADKICGTLSDRSQEITSKIEGAEGGIRSDIADVKKTMCSEMQRWGAVLEGLERRMSKAPFERIRSIVNSRLTFSGDEEEIVDMADRIVLRVINAAIKRTEDAKDMKEVRKAVDDVLEEFDKIEGVTVLPAEHKCIVVRIQCDTYKSLYNVLVYITSTVYQQRLNAIAEACCSYLRTSKPLMVNSDISEECLQNIIDRIGRTENLKQRSIVLPVQCETKEGLQNVVKLFESDVIANKLQTLSEALSKELKGSVSVEAAISNIDLKEEEEIEKTSSSEEEDVKDLLSLEGKRISFKDQKYEVSPKGTEALPKDENFSTLLDKNQSSSEEDQIAVEEIQISSKDERTKISLEGNRSSSTDQKDKFSLKGTEALSTDEKFSTLQNKIQISSKDDQIALEEIQSSSTDERDQIPLKGHQALPKYKARQGEIPHVQAMVQKGILVVAAIDIGITFTTYAYSFGTDYDRDHFQIYTYQDWKNALGISTSKTPSVVLFDKVGNFHSFGYEAEIKYSELMDEEDNAHYGWKYLNDLSLRRLGNQTVFFADDQNQWMPALDVYAAILKYLKGHLLHNLSYRLPDLNENDIQWIVSIPASLSGMEKQLIADAAEKACFSKDRLTFTLNPEVAAIYCKEQSACNAVESRGRSSSNWFRPGKQFIVLDVGGQTVIMTAHEVQRNGTISEILNSDELSPVDGSWGGCLVDAKLKTALDDLFGCDVMREFRNEYKLDALELQHSSEMMKRQCKDPENEKEDFQVWLKLPATLLKDYESLKGHRFSEGVKESNLAMSVQAKRYKMYVSNDFIIELYRESRERLTSHLRAIFQKYPELNRVNTIILTGGFMDSEILRQEIRLSFPNKHLVFPDNAGLAVVKGAVMFGYNSRM